MQIVINISDMEYNQIKAGFDVKIPSKFTLSVLEAVRNGTPLPKGHGDLIDKEKLKANINGWYAFMKDICKQPYMTLKQEEIIGKIDIMTPIIEADKESDSE